MRRSLAYEAVAWIAFAWAVANCLYVYLALNGARAFRIESAIWILVAVLVPRAVSSARSSDEVELSARQQLLLIVAALALWSAVLLPRIALSFLSDDFVFLDLYGRRATLLHSPEFFRPAFAVVFWTIAAAGRGSPIAFHVAGMGLHLASAMLVWRLATRVVVGRTTAILAGILFLLNPLQLEATLWISGLQELLWTFFLLAALCLYTAERTLTAGALAATMALVVVALLAKETAVCFVVLLPAADFVVFRFHRGPRLRTAYAGFAAIVLVYLIAHARFASSHPSFLVAPSPYFAKQLIDTPYVYFPQPWNAEVFHVPVIISAAVSTAIITLLFIRVVFRDQVRRLLVGPGVILIATLPVYSFFFVTDDLAAARYLYFPCAGWALLLAELIAGIRHRTGIALLAGAAIAGSYVCLHLNVRPWDVAAEVVSAMHGAAIVGTPPADAAVRTAAARGVQLTWKNGVPETVAGVSILRNGYSEFLRLVRSEGAAVPVR